MTPSSARVLARLFPAWTATSSCIVHHSPAWQGRPANLILGANTGDADRDSHGDFHLKHARFNVLNVLGVLAYNSPNSGGYFESDCVFANNGGYCRQLEDENRPAPFEIVRQTTLATRRLNSRRHGRSLIRRITISSSAPRISLKRSRSCQRPTTASGATLIQTKIEFNSQSADIPFTLPTAPDSERQRPSECSKRVAANKVTIDAGSGGDIGGRGRYLVLYNENESVTLLPDAEGGQNWHIVGRDKGGEQSFTDTLLNAQSDDINAKGKYLGKRVWNSTQGHPVYASGSGASAVWVDGTGTTVNTPV